MVSLTSSNNKQHFSAFQFNRNTNNHQNHPNNNNTNNHGQHNNNNNIQHPPSPQQQPQTVRGSYIFVYGSLMEKEVLRVLLGDGYKIEVMDAILTGFRRCAIVDEQYPAAIPSMHGDVIRGKILKLQSPEHDLKWLDAYEGDEYYRHQTNVVLLKNGEIVPAYVYVWVHHYERLQERDWDLHTFRRNLDTYLLSCVPYSRYNYINVNSNAAKTWLAARYHYNNNDNSVISIPIHAIWR